MTLSVLGAALAAEVDLTAGGHVKTFLVASFPYEHLTMASPDCENLLEWEDCVEATGQGIGDARLWAEARTDRLTFKAHHSTSMLAPGTQALALGTTGVGLQAPELVKLSWTATDDAGLALRGRADRLSVAMSVPHLDLALGRQPVTFGRAFFFTPLDLVSPFNPTVVDQEYKPGVDAFRVDGYWGIAGQVSAVAAWVGQPVLTWGDDAAQLEMDDAVLAVYAQDTLGVWDLGAFAGLVRRDRVLGLSTSGSVRAVGLRVEGTGTLPANPEEDRFLRAVAGADWFATGRLMLSGEVYVQTNGATEAQDYLEMYEKERFARGEVWLAGRSYAALNASYELHPLLRGGLAVVANLEDPSALLAPSLAWSVSDEVSASLSGFVGVGARPDAIAPLDLLDPGFVPGDSLNSEFGNTPVALFLSMAAYR